MRKRRLIPRKNLPARRVSDNTDKFGRPIDPPTIVDFEALNCTVQPYVGDDFILGGDGMANSRQFTIFTDTKLIEGEEGSNVKPDEVQIDGDWYRVYKVKPWLNQVIPHYEVVVIKLTGGLV